MIEVMVVVADFAGLPGVTANAGFQKESVRTDRNPVLGIFEPDVDLRQGDG